MPTSAKDFNELVSAKEREWKSLLEEQINHLTKELHAHIEKLDLEKLRFHKLKEDFEYNLNLLSERDNELSHYEEVFQQLKANDHLRNEDISQMKIKVDDVERKYERCLKEKEELQRHYQMRLGDCQNEVNICYKKKDDAVKLKDQEINQMKFQMQLKISEFEENSSAEKQRIFSEAYENSKVKEEELLMEINSKDLENHSLKLKLNMLSKELNLVRKTQNGVEETLVTKEESTSYLKKQLKEKSYELEDIANMNKLKVIELEANIKKLQKMIKDHKEEFSRRYAEHQQLSNEREQTLSKVKDAANLREEHLHEKLKSMLSKQEELQLLIKRMIWEKDDSKKDHEREVKRLEELIRESSVKRDDITKEYNQYKVAKDLEVEALRSMEGQLHESNETMKDDVYRYKSELNRALDRERILENAKTQLELDWRSRFQHKESELYLQNEKLMQNISKSKDEAVSLLKEREKEYQDLDNNFQLMQSDNDILTSCLRKYGVNIDELFDNNKDNQAVSSKSLPLEEENNQLREVIRGMREQLEMMTTDTTSQVTTPEKLNTKNKDYAKDLENEISNLKSTNRNLKNRLDDYVNEQKPPIGGNYQIMDEQILNKISDHSVKKFVKGLQQMIAVLQKEEVTLKESIESKDATISHLNVFISKIGKEKKESLSLDSGDVIKLKKKISELELMLKHSKIDHTSITNTAKENKEDYHQVSKSGDEKLKEKLQLAISRIRELTKERALLIDVGNKLKAQLSAAQTINGCESNGTNDADRLQTLNKFNKPKQHIDVGLKKREPQQIDMEVINREKINFHTTKFHTNTGKQDNNNIVQDDSVATASSIQYDSSTENYSLKEVWKILDDGELLSSTIDSKQSNDGMTPSEQINVIGKQIQKEERKIVKNHDVRRTKVASKKINTQIRNYNDKDGR